MRSLAQSFVIALLTCTVLALVTANLATMEVGYSDAPGDVTCVQCHYTFVQNSGTGSAILAAPEEFTPGQTYDLVLTVNHATLDVAGFQMSSRDGDEGAAGIFGDTDGVIIGMAENGSYATHDGGKPLSGGSASWTIPWTAPTSGTGDVTIHASVVIANGGGTPEGDFVYTISKRIHEAFIVPIPFMVIPNGTGVAIDGLLLANEWDDAETGEYPFRGGFATISVKHNGTHLLFATIFSARGETETMYFSFGDGGEEWIGDLDGKYDDTKFIQLLTNGSSTFIDGTNTGSSVRIDLMADDTEEGVPRIQAVLNNDEWTLEWAIPLRSGTTEDLRVTSDETIGFFVVDDRLNAFPSQASKKDGSNWSVLQFQDMNHTPPPEVMVHDASFETCFGCEASQVYAGDHLSIVVDVESRHTGDAPVTITLYEGGIVSGTVIDTTTISQGRENVTLSIPSVPDGSTLYYASVAMDGGLLDDDRLDDYQAVNVFGIDQSITISTLDDELTMLMEDSISLDVTNTGNAGTTFTITGSSEVGGFTVDTPSIDPGMTETVVVTLTSAVPEVLSYDPLEDTLDLDFLLDAGINTTFTFQAWNSADIEVPVTGEVDFDLVFQDRYNISMEYRPTEEEDVFELDTPGIIPLEYIDMMDTLGLLPMVEPVGTASDAIPSMIIELQGMDTIVVFGYLNDSIRYASRFSLDGASIPEGTTTTILPISIENAVEPGSSIQVNGTTFDGSLFHDDTLTIKAPDTFGVTLSGVDKRCPASECQGEQWLLSITSAGTKTTTISNVDWSATRCPEKTCDIPLVINGTIQGIPMSPGSVVTLDSGIFFQEDSKDGTYSYHISLGYSAVGSTLGDGSTSALLETVLGRDPGDGVDLNPAKPGSSLEGNAPLIIAPLALGGLVVFVVIMIRRR